MNKAAKIVIVEDEYITAKTISNFLEASGYEVVGCAMDTKEALYLLENFEVDCIILDININDVKDGIWIADHIKENYQIPYLFLTAYTDKETVSKAIQTSPYGFLAKPFQKAELFSAIEIALFKHNELITLQNASTTSEDKSVTAQFLFLKNVDRLDKVAIEDVCFIESQKNYLHIHTDTQVYKHRATLKEFMELLPDSNFIRTHRAFVVNIFKVDSINKAEETVRIGNATVQLSKSFKREFLDKLT